MESTFRYEIEAKYEYRKEMFTISAPQITGMIINYDYVNNNMPIIILKCNIDKRMVNDMVENINKKTILLKVSKYNNESTMKIKDNYIYDEFEYFLDESLMKNLDKIDYPDDGIQNENLFVEITIGLLSSKLIKNNKILINGVYTNQRLLEILLMNMSHMNLLIEEPYNETVYDNIIIPPLSTVTSFVEYLDNQFSIYKNHGFRLFYDFDKTYLLSSRGIGIESRKDRYNNIYFKVSKETNYVDSIVQGMVKDKKSKTYSIDLAKEDIETYTNNSNVKKYGNIIAIDDEGNTERLDLDKNKSEKSLIKRTNIMDHVDRLKTDLEENVICNVNKIDLDSSIFTINKEYFIDNYDKNGNKSRFILNSKREVFIKEDSSFINAMQLSFSRKNSLSGN